MIVKLKQNRCLSFLTDFSRPGDPGTLIDQQPAFCLVFDPLHNPHNLNLFTKTLIKTLAAFSRPHVLAITSFPSFSGLETCTSVHDKCRNKERNFWEDFFWLFEGSSEETVKEKKHKGHRLLLLVLTL